MLVANSAWNFWNYRSALIRHLVHQGFAVVLVAPADRFSTSWATHSNVSFVPLQHLSRKSFSPLKNLWLLQEFRKVFLSEQPDVILLFTIKPNILGNLAARLTGFPCISVIEGLGYSGASGVRWRYIAAPLYRLALRKTQQVIFLNREDAQEFLEQALVDKSQCRIIHGPGIDLEHFLYQEKSGNQCVFLFSGRLLIDKGIRDFVAAARQIRLEQPDVSFQILGAPDPENPNSVRPGEPESWNQEGVIQYLGQMDDVRPVLAQADVLVLPSYYREGVPRTILEAMALGKIIITTDMPGCRDTVDPGQNGFLVPPRDKHAIVEAMLQVLALPVKVRQRMGQHSRQKVKSIFSDEQILPQYLDVIQSVL